MWLTLRSWFDCINYPFSHLSFSLSCTVAAIILKISRTIAPKSWFPVFLILAFGLYSQAIQTMQIEISTFLPNLRLSQMVRPIIPRAIFSCRDASLWDSAIRQRKCHVSIRKVAQERGKFRKFFKQDRGKNAFGMLPCYSTKIAFAEMDININK